MLASMHDLPEPAFSSRSAPIEPEDESDRKLRFIRRRQTRNDMEAAE